MREDASRFTGANVELTTQDAGIVTANQERPSNVTNKVNEIASNSKQKLQTAEISVKPPEDHSTTWWLTHPQRV